MNAFEKDTAYRLLVEAARVWVVSTFLATKRLPERMVLFVYGNGPSSNMGWGNAPGPKTSDTPMKGKRVRITLEIEEPTP